MLFPTITFAGFFLVVWPVTWVASRWPVARQLVLLVASLVFYAYWDVGFVPLLLGTVLIAHVGARAIQSAAGRPSLQRAVLWAAVGLHLLVLGWFKYYGFFASSVTGALDRLGLHTQAPVLQVLLPLGISFFTFEAIAYLIEVRRGVLGAGSLLEIASWLTFFPTMASGPITRASELVPQLREPPRARIDANRAFFLIARGLFKKLVIASFLASAITDGVFASPALYSGPEVLVGIYGYAVLLFVDFSGYCDMAIGLALLLGIEVPENFNAPYSARSVTEFWTRWHMTLSRWLRDFVFTPLTLRSSRTTTATVRNLMLVMLLAGLWHGAAWTFVIFGAVHGVALAAERVARERRRREGRPAPAPTWWSQAWHRALTFNVVCLGWVFFRADSVQSALDVLGRLTSGWGTDPSSLTPLLALTIGGLLLLQNAPRRLFEVGDELLARAALPILAVSLAVALVVTDVMAPEGIAPFVYFGF